MGRITRLVTAASVSLGLGLAASPALAASQPTGERMHGQVSVEPAYDDTTGNLTFLATPIHVALPTNDSLRTTHATAPLYLVIYPAGTSFDVPFNCEGPAFPDNCPDHDLPVALAANLFEPTVYPVPAQVPGHDHLVAVPASHGDFNISWEVIEVMFTPEAVANGAITHLTTLNEIQLAEGAGNAIQRDLGFAFHCSVVSASAY